MSAPAGERRIASVLLVDVADSTTIGEQLGPERSKFLFDEVVRLLAAEVKRFGGTVAQLTGDGLYALFGVPKAHDDDAERAVRAAVAMQAALKAYGVGVADAYGIDIAARVAVNTGPVVVLPEGAPVEERYNALGDTVNTAARLQPAAGRGGIIVGSGTARHIEHRFELEDVGLLELRGRAERVAAYRVVGERAAAVRRLSPLVGRARELDELDAVFAALAEGRGAIVAITGEPGIGKSRLVAEITSRWAGRVRCASAQAISYSQDIPYYPIRELLRSHLGLGVTDPEARLRLELKAQLAITLAGDADARYPFLASLLGIELDGDAQARLNGLARDSIQRQTHEAVVAFTRAQAHRQPLALVLEDLHFADEPTLELFQELLSVTEEEPLAILLLYRNDPDLPSWALGEAARRLYRHRFSELQLAPLAPEEGAQLAAAAAGGELPRGVAVLLADRTGGNPLFLEEAARDAFERGDGGAVPAAVEETLQARLDRLSPTVREVASVASVIGRSFGAPLLERLVPSEQLRPALSELQRLDLIVEERRRPTPEYRFRHGLVQEAAYTSLLEGRRRELHRSVGSVLEELERDELAGVYGVLAHHFASADEAERGARYLLRAGDAARTVYADEEAIAHYRRALPFLDRLGDTATARSVLFRIGFAYHLDYDFEAAAAAWAEAFARPEPPPRRLAPIERLSAPIADTSFVPGYGYDTFSWGFGANCFSGLLCFDGGLDVVPDLAEQFTVSPDGCRYDFRLRRGLRWSDGHPLTAHDFEFTYRAMQERAVETAFLLGDVEARAVNDEALELRFPEPSGYLPFLLAQLPFFPWPAHRIEELQSDVPPRVLSAVNGPFVPGDRDGGRLLLSRNANWHGGYGNVGEISLHPSDSLNATNDWQAGKHDFAFLGPLPGIGDLVDDGTVTVPTLSFEYLGFSSSPPFDDVRVRQALARGLDRTPLLAGRPATAAAPALGGLLPPSMPGHSHELAPPFDLEAARGLLGEAGYPDGRGLPELRLLHADFNESDERHRATEALWADQWRELGVRVRQEWVPHDEVAGAIAAGRAMWEWAWNSDYPDPHGILGTLTEQYLASIPGSAELSSLLTRARSTRDRDVRLQLYRGIDRLFVADQTWFVPTVYDTWLILRRPWVEGLWGSALGIGRLDNVVVRRAGEPG